MKISWKSSSVIVILVGLIQASSSAYADKESKYIDIKYESLILRYLNGQEGFCGDLKKFVVAMEWQKANPGRVMDNELLSAVLRINGAIERIGPSGVDKLIKLC